MLKIGTVYRLLFISMQHSTYTSVSVLLEVFLEHKFNDGQRGTTHQPGPRKNHEPRHERDSNTITLRELFVPFALLAQLAPSSARYAPSQTTRQRPCHGSLVEYWHRLGRNLVTEGGQSMATMQERLLMRGSRAEHARLWVWVWHRHIVRYITECHCLLRIE